MQPKPNYPAALRLDPLYRRFFMAFVAWIDLLDEQYELHGTHFCPVKLLDIQSTLSNDDRHSLIRVHRTDERPALRATNHQDFVRFFFRKPKEVDDNRKRRRYGLANLFQAASSYTWCSISFRVPVKVVN